MNKRILSLVAAPIFALAFIKAPVPANFSGDWSLNEAKSELGDFGGRIAPHKIKVDQKDASITISKTGPSFNGDDVTTTETLTFDGKETESTVFGSAKRKATVKWGENGQSFVISYTIAFERNGQTSEIKGTETWTMTSDGKSILLATASTGPQGDFGMKATYDKQ